MFKKQHFFSVFGVIFGFLGLLMAPGGLTADVRGDYLIDLLKKGSSYRVKIQAAQSLGRIQSRDAIPALEEALNDHSPHVVIAAAAALGEIGDPAALPALKAALRKGHSRPVKNQLQTSIQLLQSLQGDEETIEITSPSGAPRFLVKVDAMGNSSSSTTPGIAMSLQETVTRVLQQQDGIELQSGNMSPSVVKRKINKGKLKAFILSGALIKLQREQNYMVAKIALNVLTNPDYNLVMMPSGEARVPINLAPIREAARNGSSPAVIRQLEKDAEASAEKIVIEKLVESLLVKILQAAPGVL